MGQISQNDCRGHSACRGRGVAIFNATLPHDGLWKLEYHFPLDDVTRIGEKTRRQLHDVSAQFQYPDNPKLGSYFITIKDGERTIPIEFDISVAPQRMELVRRSLNCIRPRWRSPSSIAAKRWCTRTQFDGQPSQGQIEQELTEDQFLSERCNFKSCDDPSETLFRAFLRC